MVRSISFLAAAVAAILSLPAATMHAQTGAAAPTTASMAPAAGDVEAFLKRLKHPAPWLTWGADFRARNEYYEKIVTLADTALAEQDVFRFRGRINATATVSPDFTVNARLAAEARYWDKPAFVGAFKGRTGWEKRFVMFDAFAAKWTNLFDGAATLTLGRQDIFLGDPLDWWLVMDGTPNDGSWTTYFDAARLTIDAKSMKTRFDVIALTEFTQPDEWLGTIGRCESYPTTDQKEDGFILYAANKSLPNTQLDTYYIFKHDQQRMVTVAGASRLSGDNANLHTVGAKVTGTPTPHLQYSVEGAFQFGAKEDRIAGVFASRDVSAWGAKGKLTYSLKDPLNQRFTFAGELLSGDDPGSTGRDEMFDVLWGRWPMWSELTIYSYIYETGGRIAQMNNLGRLGAGWSSTPRKGTNVSLTYHALFALEETPTRAIAPALFSRDGRFRGHHVQAWVKHQFNPHLSGHLWAEWVWQGNFYAQRELMTFLRAELMIGF